MPLASTKPQLEDDVCPSEVSIVINNINITHILVYLATYFPPTVNFAA